MEKTFVILLCMLSLTVAAERATAQRIEKKVVYQESSARNIEPRQGVIMTPLIADMEVMGDRIRFVEMKAFEAYPVSADILPYVPEFKKIALSNAAKSCGADVIIGATIDVVTNSEGKLEICVAGYPARYVNFRNATADDAWMVSLFGIIHNAQDADIISIPKATNRINIDQNL